MCKNVRFLEALCNNSTTGSVAFFCQKQWSTKQNVDNLFPTDTVERQLFKLSVCFDIDIDNAIHCTRISSSRMDFTLDIYEDI